MMPPLHGTALVPLWMDGGGSLYLHRMMGISSGTSIFLAEHLLNEKKIVLKSCF